MPAVMDAPAHVRDSASLDGLSANMRKVAHLKAHQFTSENNPAKTNPAAHRQPGVQNARTIYLDSLPLKAKQWVKSTHPSVLIDARKLTIPDVDIHESSTVISIQTVRGLTQDHATLACINTSQRRGSVEPPPPSASVDDLDGGEPVSPRHERVEADG